MGSKSLKRKKSEDISIIWAKKKKKIFRIEWVMRIEGLFIIGEK